LLSSHLLSEVEQLCTRIAVLNKGRKVFEGRITEVRAARSRVALKTPDFAAAAIILGEHGLIAGTEGGEFISLKAGITTADVARTLVSAGIAVEGIWQRQQTLEDFYLDLVKAPPATAAKN
jgi:ABC-2 type transport system ATP-binding protein